MQPLTHNSSQKRLIIALALGLAYLVVLMIGGYYSDSIALKANAGHMMVHNGILIIALIAATIAKKEPNSKFSSGYSKIETIGGYTNGLILLALAFFIGIEVINRHEHSHHELNTSIMGITAAIGLILHACSAVVLYKGRRESLNVYAAFLHIFFDVTATILALIAGIIIHYTGMEIFDSFTAVAIVMLISISSIRLIWNSSRQLMDVVPNNIDYNKVVKKLKEVEHIESVHHVIIHNKGNNIMLSAHLVLKDACLASNCWRTCREAAQRILEEEFNISYSVLQMEAKEEHNHEHKNSK